MWVLGNSMHRNAFKASWKREKGLFMCIISCFLHLWTLLWLKRKAAFSWLLYCTLFIHLELIKAQYFRMSNKLEYVAVCPFTALQSWPSSQLKVWERAVPFELRKLRKMIPIHGWQTRSPLKRCQFATNWHLCLIPSSCAHSTLNDPK